MINLTQTEIIEITGKRYAKYQCQWLRENGFTFKLNGDGRPLVSRAHYLQVMGVSLDKPIADDEPDFRHAS